MVISLLCMPIVRADGVDGTTTDLEYVACGETKGIPKPVPELISAGYTILVIATPIVLIIFSIITLVKAVSAGNADDISKARGKLVKKFIIAGAVFFVAGITQFVITRAASGTDYSLTKCLSCFLYNDGCTADSGPDMGRN